MDFEFDNYREPTIASAGERANMATDKADGDNLLSSLKYFMRQNVFADIFEELAGPSDQQQQWGSGTGGGRHRSTSCPRGARVPSIVNPPKPYSPGARRTTANQQQQHQDGSPGQGRGRSDRSAGMDGWAAWGNSPMKPSSSSGGSGGGDGPQTFSPRRAVVSLSFASQSLHASPQSPQQKGLIDAVVSGFSTIGQKATNWMNVLDSNFEQIFQNDLQNSQPGDSDSSSSSTPRSLVEKDRRGGGHGTPKAREEEEKTAVSGISSQQQQQPVSVSNKRPMQLPVGNPGSAAAPVKQIGATLGRKSSTKLGATRLGAAAAAASAAVLTSAASATSCLSPQTQAQRLFTPSATAAAAAGAGGSCSMAGRGAGTPDQKLPGVSRRDSPGMHIHMGDVDMHLFSMLLHEQKKALRDTAEGASVAADAAAAAACRAHPLSAAGAAASAGAGTARTSAGIGDSTGDRAATSVSAPAAISAGAPAAGAAAAAAVVRGRASVDNTADERPRRVRKPSAPAASSGATAADVAACIMQGVAGSASAAAAAATVEKRRGCLRALLTEVATLRQDQQAMAAQLDELKLYNECLAGENSRLKEGEEADPLLGETVRRQLELLLQDKGRLMEENARLASENRGLHELLTFTAEHAGVGNESPDTPCGGRWQRGCDSSSNSNVGEEEEEECGQAQPAAGLESRAEDRLQESIPRELVFGDDDEVGEVRRLYSYLTPLTPMEAWDPEEVASALASSAMAMLSLQPPADADAGNAGDVSGYAAAKDMEGEAENLLSSVPLCTFEVAVTAADKKLPVDDEEREESSGVVAAEAEGYHAAAACVGSAAPAALLGQELVSLFADIKIVSESSDALSASKKMIQREQKAGLAGTAAAAAANPGGP